MTVPVLQLQNFRVGFDDKTVLDGIDLEVFPRQTMVVMGPGGSGKSTLLRTICGFNDGHRALHMSGQALYLGRGLNADHRPVLIEQTPQPMMNTVYEFLASHSQDRSQWTRQQLRERLTNQLIDWKLPSLCSHFDTSLLELAPGARRLALVVAGALQQPPLLCVDEPTAGLQDAARVLDFLQLQSSQRAILMVTHNQRHARLMADQVGLLAGGRICELSTTEQFFDAPSTPQAQSFVKTGSCTIASPDTPPEELNDNYRGHQPTDNTTMLLNSDNSDQPRAGSAPSARRGPTGFHWMRPGQLAGTPLPGGMRPIEDDLEALRRVGVTVLITLTEQPLDSEPLESFSITNIHVPIVDMDVPSLQSAADCCRTVDRALDEDQVVAFHCRAGIGRTGTMLALYEIWDGASAEQAFRTTRGVHRRWIQSKRQKEFLSEFEHWLE